MIPVVLSIGALDPLGADGLLADIRSFAALGAHGAAAATLVGAPGAAQAPEIVAGQIAEVRAATSVAAVKIGALGSAALARAVAEALAGLGVPIVADPSFAGRASAAETGAAETGPAEPDPAQPDPAQPDAPEPDATPPDTDLVEAWRTLVLPLAAVITPNLAEAALLTGTPRATTLGQMRAQGEALVAMGCPNVVVSGGHGASAASIDILVTNHRPPLEMRAERLERGAMRGLSATLAAAVAAHLAHGMDPFGSVHAARLFVSTAVGAAVAHGPGGPVLAHQMARMWRKPPPPLREE